MALGSLIKPYLTSFVYCCGVRPLAGAKEKVLSIYPWSFFYFLAVRFEPQFVSLRGDSYGSITRSKIGSFTFIYVMIACSEQLD